MERHGIQLDSPEVQAFCRRWKINELFVFGTYLRDDFRADSDIDLLAEFDADEQWDLFDLTAMQDELTTILHRNVELVDREALRRHDNWLLKRAVFAAEER